MTSKYYQLDNVDQAILSRLMADAKIPFTEIARELLVSPGTIHVRMKRMERRGIVKGSTLIVDPRKLGYDLTAFVGIYLVKGSVYSAVIEQIKEIPEIIEAHYTTGEYGIFAKVVCRNTDHLREIINEKLQAIDGVSRTETIISLGQSVQQPLPLL